jgi:hypothetical protein
VHDPWIITPFSTLLRSSGAFVRTTVWMKVEKVGRGVGMSTCGRERSTVGGGVQVSARNRVAWVGVGVIHNWSGLYDC